MVGEQVGTPASALKTGPGSTHSLDTEGTSSRCTREGVILVLRHGCMVKVRDSCQILVHMSVLRLHPRPVRISFVAGSGNISSFYGCPGDSNVLPR